MLIPALFALGSQPTHPRVVIAARYYNPPGSGRPSTQAGLYLISSDGSRQLLARHHGINITECRWISCGSSKLGRVIYAVQLREYPRKDELWLVDVAPRVRQKLGSLDFERESLGSELFDQPPGMPSDIVARFPRLFPYRVKVPGFESPWVDAEEGKLVSKMHPSLAVTWRIPHAFFWQGKPIAIPGDGGFQRGIYDPVTDSLWFTTWTTVSTNGSWTSVSRLNWKTGKAELVIKDGQNIDWWPRSDWAAYTTRRDLSDYGPKHQVWTSHAYLKNVRTGKLWTLAKGLVEVRSASVEPDGVGKRRH